MKSVLVTGVMVIAFSGPTSCFYSLCLTEEQEWESNVGGTWKPAEIHHRSFSTRPVKFNKIKCFLDCLDRESHAKHSRQVFECMQKKEGLGQVQSRESSKEYSLGQSRTLRDLENMINEEIRIGYSKKTKKTGSLFFQCIKHAINKTITCFSQQLDCSYSDSATMQNKLV